MRSRSAVQVQVSADLTVPVASLAGIAGLKLFAWQDRYTTDKDALDLYRVISTYADAVNFDRLYEEATQLLEQAEYDIELGGAALLGFDPHPWRSYIAATRFRSYNGQP